VLGWIEIVLIPVVFFVVARFLCRGMYDYPASIYGWLWHDRESGAHSH
jgi:hypothetical protein